MKKSLKIYMCIFPCILIALIFVFLITLGNIPKLNTAWIIILFALIFGIGFIAFTTYIASSVYMLYTSTKTDLCKLNKVIRLSHIIPNIIISLIVIILVATLFTIGFAFVIILLHFVMYTTANIIGLITVFKNKNKITNSGMFVVLQFIFIADIVTAIMIDRLPTNLNTIIIEEEN